MCKEIRNRLLVYSSDRFYMQLILNHLKDQFLSYIPKIKG